jgi:hypothetical protein
MHASHPERLVGVDVADARHQLLIQQCSLDRSILPPQPRDGIGQVKFWIERITPNVGDFLRQLRTSFGDGKTTEHALIDKAQAGLTVSESEDDSGVRSEWRIGISQAKLATHPQVSQDRVAVGEG